MRRFWEKPSPELAVEFWKRGFLWNSFVLVARITALIDLFVRALPKLYTAFAQSLSVLDTASESEAMDQLYTNISTESFAERILSFTAYSARGGWIVRRAHRRRGSENGA